MRMPSAKAELCWLIPPSYRQNDLHRGRRDKSYGNTQGSYENLVGGQRDAINQAIQLPIQKRKASPGMKIKKEFIPQLYRLTPWHRFKSTATDVRLGSALTSNDYSISGDAASAQIVRCK